MGGIHVRPGFLTSNVLLVPAMSIHYSEINEGDHSLRYVWFPFGWCWILNQQWTNMQPAEQRLHLEETNVTVLATIHSYIYYRYDSTFLYALYIINRGFKMPKTSNQTLSGYVKLPAMRFVMSVKFECMADDHHALTVPLYQHVHGI